MAAKVKEQSLEAKVTQKNKAKPRLTFHTSMDAWCIDPNNIDCQNVINEELVGLINITSSVAINHHYFQLYLLPWG